MSPAAQASTEVQLEYAPGEAARRHRRVRRIAGAVVLLVLVALGIWFGPGLWWRARMMHAVWQARRYVAPAEQVVYANAPGTIGPFTTWAGSSATTTKPAAGPRVAADPTAWSRLAGFEPGYNALFAPRGARPEPLVFLHERRAPNGTTLIVAVRISGVTYYPVDGGTLACSYGHVLLQPNGWNAPTGVAMGRAWGGVHLDSAAASLQRSGDNTSGDGPAQPGAVRVFFGAPEPTNPSEFTVPYEVNGTRKQWRFRLTDRGLDLDEQASGARPPVIGTSDAPRRRGG